MSVSTKSSNNKRIAVFASGTGSNTIAIFRHFKENPHVELALIASNNSNAGILANPEVEQIPKWVFSRQDFRSESIVISRLSEERIDFIVLAGFLWLIPDFLVAAYPSKVINIHPALLPKYGGKGMYGSNVHKAVLAANEQISGITIHFVNQKYDEGEIILQVQCDISKCKSADEIAKKIHALEHFYYKRIINQLLLE